MIVHTCGLQSSISTHGHVECVTLRLEACCLFLLFVPLISTRLLGVLGLPMMLCNTGNLFYSSFHLVSETICKAGIDSNRKHKETAAQTGQELPQGHRTRSSRAQITTRSWLAPQGRIFPWAPRAILLLLAESPQSHSEPLQMDLRWSTRLYQRSSLFSATRLIFV